MPMYGGKRIYAPQPSYQRPLKRARYGKSSTAKISQFNRYTAPGASSSGTLRQQVSSLRRVVNKMKPEMKYLDSTLSQNNITDASGHVASMVAIAQGDTQSTRTGNEILLKNWKINIFANRASTNSAGANAYFRFAVVCDKQQVADTTPGADDIFSTVAPALASPELAGLERFKFLYVSPIVDLNRIQPDSDHLTAVTPTANSAFEVTGKCDIKIGYNGTASTDLQKNGVFLCVLVSGMNNEFDFTCVSRVGFVDV